MDDKEYECGNQWSTLDAEVRYFERVVDDYYYHTEYCINEIELAFKNI